MLGSRALPPSRTALGRELRAWRAALLTDLGGEGAVSTQRETLVDAAVRTKLLVDSIDAYLLGLPSLVDKRHRRLWPVVQQRQALVGQLQSLLRDLGLERRAREAPDLRAYLASRGTTGEGDVTPATTSPSHRKMIVPPPDSIGGETNNPNPPEQSGEPQ